MNVNRAMRDINILSPYFFQELVTSNDLCRSLHQERQNLKLLVCYFDRRLALHDFVFLQIDADGAALYRVAALFRLGPPQYRANAGEQFGQAEGFRDVVIRAELESPDLVGFLSSCRENNDRRSDASLAKFGADLEAVFARKHQVQNDQMRGRLQNRLKAGDAVFCETHVESFEFQFVLDRHGNSGLIFDNQNRFIHT